MLFFFLTTLISLMQTWYGFLLLFSTVSTITPNSNKGKKVFQFLTSTVKGLLENSFTKRFAIVQLKYTHNFQGTVNKRITFKSLANGFKFRGLDPRPQYSASLLVHTWLICITIICKQIMREEKKEKSRFPWFYRWIKEKEMIALLPEVYRFRLAMQFT